MKNLTFLQNPFRVRGQGMDINQKRLWYKANHRGTKEADLILTRGIQPFLERSLSKEEVGLLNQLLDLPDPVLMDWLLGGGGRPEALSPHPLWEQFEEALRQGLKNNA